MFVYSFIIFLKKYGCFYFLKRLLRMSCMVLFGVVDNFVELRYNYIYFIDEEIEVEREIFILIIIDNTWCFVLGFMLGLERRVR